MASAEADAAAVVEAGAARCQVLAPTQPNALRNVLCRPSARDAVDFDASPPSNLGFATDRNKALKWPWNISMNASIIYPEPLSKRSMKLATAQPASTYARRHFGFQASNKDNKEAR